MESDWNRWLRERAYALWENEGRPDGKDSEHWSRAEAELKQNAAPSDDGKDSSENPHIPNPD